MAADHARGAADAPKRLLFVGISLGGALAQMSALYAAHTQPAIASLVQAVAFGGTPWASAEVRTLKDA